MKVSNTASRLKHLLNKNNMRAIDLVNKCQPFCKKYNVKMGRNDISQYLSGKVEPSQKKLSILALALNVNEIYLMGYDVPIDYEKTDEYRDSEIFNSIDSLCKTPLDKELLYKASKLNDNNKLTIKNSVNEMLLKQGNYFEKDELDNKLYDPYEVEFNSDLDLINPQSFDELELLFDKHRDILTDSDKNKIKKIIEERKKEIDKELGGE